jgi:hypothetical protein
MLKLFSILVALLPAFLLLRAMLARPSRPKQALSGLRKELDTIVWVMLFLIAIAVTYSVVVVILSFRG